MRVLQNTNSQKMEPSSPPKMKVVQTRPVKYYDTTGDAPTSDIPLEPLFDTSLPSPLPSGPAPVPETRRQEALFPPSLQDDAVKLAARLALEILRENDLLLDRVVNRLAEIRRDEKNKEVVKRINRTNNSGTKRVFDPQTPSPESQKPTKRATPGSAEGEMEIDAIISALIGKMFANAPLLPKLSTKEAADAIETLMRDSNNATINAYIDASIEEVGQNAALAEMPIGCFYPNCGKQQNFRCTGCKAAYYCSEICQKAHWSRHSKKCTQ